jgi:hypothetical protein
LIALSIDEQIEIDRAEHDGEGWALPPHTPGPLQERLATKGLIRLWKGRWQLTPLGYSKTSRFK